MREQALFHADHKDDGEFQAFRLVEGDKGYGVGFLVKTIYVGDEAEAFKKGGERLGSVKVGEIAGAGAEFLDVFQALIAAVGLVGEPTGVAAALQHGVDEFLQIKAFALVGNALDEVVKGCKGCQGAGGEGGAENAGGGCRGVALR